MKKLFQPSQLIVIKWDDEDVCTASLNGDGEHDHEDVYGERY